MGKKKLPDVIYVNRENHQIAPKGGTDTETYIRLGVIHSELYYDTTPNYESINLAIVLQRKLIEESEAVKVWRNRISSHIQERGDKLPNIPFADLSSAQRHLKDASLEIERAVGLLARTEIYLSK